MHYFTHGLSFEEIAEKDVGSQIEWKSAKFSQLAEGGICWVSSMVADWQGVVKNAVVQQIWPVVVTTHLSVPEMKMALALGAKGYCMEASLSRSHSDISDAVSHGGIWIPGDLITTVVGQLRHHPSYSIELGLLEVLTTREKEVLNLLLKGHSNQQTALTLKITVRTVKEHMSSILRKFRVKDRVALLLKIGKFERVD